MFKNFKQGKKSLNFNFCLHLRILWYCYVSHQYSLPSIPRFWFVAISLAAWNSAILSLLMQPFFIFCVKKNIELCSDASLQHIFQSRNWRIKKNKKRKRIKIIFIIFGWYCSVKITHIYRAKLFKSWINKKQDF